MSGASPSPTNLQRLKDKLKKDSLAIRLVEARMNAKAGTEAAALKKVIDDRLDELRKKHAGAADHQLEIQGFRSFGPKPQTLVLPSLIAAVRAPNSHGKTALAETFEFLLTGRIVRRELLASSPG